MILRIYIFYVISVSDYVLTSTNHPLFFNDKLRCNCRGNEMCNETGKCPSEKCERPYIGVTCQHVDIELARLKTTCPKYQYLHDGDASTCAYLSLTGTVAYGIRQFVSFFWVYISRSKEEDMSPNLELRQDFVVMKTTPYYFKVSETSVLIKIAERVTYNVLELTNLPSDICSVDISLGRNLALSGRATQISTRGNQPYYSAQEASNGHEGNEALTIQGQGCSTTEGNKAGDWWRIRLKYDARINAVHLKYPAKSACQFEQINVKTFTASGDIVFTMDADYTKDTKNGNFFFVGDGKLVKDVALTKSTRTSDKNFFPLQLCEVLIYGEFQCPDDQYGALCEVTCPGCGRDLCDPDWGCLGGCKKPWVLNGQWCAEDCSKRCLGKCENDTGRCLEGCQPGLLWDNCTDPCPGGYFGHNCTEFCENCAVENGKDVPACEPESGRCLVGCQPGLVWINEICTDPCPAGYFGQNCTEFCENCAAENGTDVPACERKTGRCLHGCADGYDGPGCTEVFDLRDFLVPALGLFLVMLMVFLCVSAVFASKRKRRNEDAESSRASSRHSERKGAQSPLSTDTGSASSSSSSSTSSEEEKEDERRASKSSRKSTASSVEISARTRSTGSTRATGSTGSRYSDSEYIPPEPGVFLFA